MNLKLHKGLLTMSLLAGLTSACDAAAIEKITLSYDQIIEKTMRPFEGTAAPGVDTSTLTGKVMCGYQGWFTCPGDGSGMGWFHWGLPTTAPSDQFKPGTCSIDLWPDMSEYPKAVQYPTDFKYADGTTATVYSSMHPEVADVHFQWMKEYGIDGVFVQRFAAQTFKTFEFNNVNIVLDNCRAAANKHGRAYAVMYDLTGVKVNQTDHVINDIKLLVDKMKIARDPNDKAYLHHKGKPVIALWGIGFGDNRPYTLKDCERLIRFLKDDPHYGGFTVMLGVPTYWREQKNDTMTDPELHRVLQMADILSPWTVGRFGGLEDVDSTFEPLWRQDRLWCKERNLDYLPVAFPGFSWVNLQGRGYNHIPRRKGEFLWKQITGAKKAGAQMVYIAMFDEVDEATAIYKCTNTPPVGESRFLTYEDLPSDYYLRLTGLAGKLMRGERITEQDKAGLSEGILSSLGE